MIPFLMQAGASMLPGLLNHLFGGDPQKAYRSRVNKIISPQNMGMLTNQFYQQNLGSPAFAQGQRAIGAGANQAQNNVMGALGARGLGTSGLGAIMSSLSPSLVGSQMSGLYSGAYGAAQGQAQNSIQQQLGALKDTYGPSQTQQMFGGGLAALGPILQQLMGQMGGGGDAGGGLRMGQAGFKYPLGGQ